MRGFLSRIKQSTATANRSSDVFSGTRGTMSAVKKITAAAVFLSIFAGVGYAVLRHASSLPVHTNSADQSVLAASTGTQGDVSRISFNIPAVFNDDATFKKALTVDGPITFNHDIEAANHNLNLGTGNITAANIPKALLAGVVPGNGIAVTTGQTPTVSNTGVLSLQNQTGALSLIAGSGISINGLTVSNTASFSDANAFATVSDGTNSFSAGSTKDTVTFAAGSGITISTDTTNKKLTFTSSAGGLAGLTTNGVLYATSGTTATSLAPGTSGFVLQSNGAGSPPSWVSNNAANPPFSAIANGTNTTSSMIVGTGASLSFSGSGTINASTLLGGTWASPGTIGSGVANTGAFTTLSGTTVTATTFNGLTVTNNGSNALTIAAGKTLTASNTLTLAGTDGKTLTFNNNLTFGGTDGTSFVFPSTSDTLIGRNSADTLTNKTIAAGSNTITGLTNANLSGAAGITNANLANSSVTVNTSAPLGGGGSVSLGGAALTLTCATCVLSGGNLFTVAATSGSSSTITQGGTLTLSAGSNITTTNNGTGTVAIATSLTPAFTTVNGLTLTSNADGFSLSGGTTSRTINVTGSNITLTGGGNTLTLTGNTSLNQNLLTTSAPSFTGLTLSGLGTGIVHTSSGVFSSSAVDLASSDIAGVLNETHGGTNQNAYTKGDILFASALNTLAKLPVGSSTQVLGVSAGVPAWTTITGAGGLCTDCVITDPTTTLADTIAPATNGVVSLTLRETSVGSADILDVQSTGGGTTYLKVDNSGVVTINNNSIALGGGNESISLTANKNVAFADTFMTSGAHPLTLTTSGATNVTLPTTGTVLTNTASANQTVTSTQTTGTVLGVTDSTNISAAVTGASITLSGTGAFDQTGLAFNLSGASGANLNDIVGSGSTWKISTTGDATFNSLTTTNVLNAAAVTSSGVFKAANGSAGSPSYAFTNSTGTGLYLASVNNLGISTNGTERIRVDSSGNIGVGTTAPISLLHVEGAVTGKALTVLNYTGTDQNILVASASGVTKFVLDNTGTITTGIWNATTINQAYGGTNQTAYTKGDILYADGSNTLSKLPIGSTGQALVVTGGVPVWTAISGGAGCTDCVLNDPSTGTVNTILPTAGSVTPLTLKAAPSGTNDLFDIKSNNGVTTYFAVNSAGNIATGVWNGTVIGQAYGGTNQSAYTKGDILYADGSNNLVKLPVGSSTQVLGVSGGIPAWTTISGGSGGLCSDCVITDPTTSLSDTIAPATNGVVGLTLRETSVGSADIVDFQNAGGGTTYAKIDSNGDLTLNNNVFLANGANSNRYKIDTSGNGFFPLLHSDAITSGLFNGNTISTSSGTLTLAAGKTLTANSTLTLAGVDGKTLTVNDSTTLGTNAVAFAGTESLTLAATKNVLFADAFTTSGANPLTLTTSGSTNVTLPTTGTLLTNTASANQTITSTQTSGTLLSLVDSTNIASAITGQSISLSGTGAFDQTGLLITLQGASGTNLNALVVNDGTNNNATLSKLGVLTLGKASTNQGSLVLANTTANVLTLKSSNLQSAGYTITLPVSGGTNGYVLQTDGSGTTSWVAPSGLGTNFWQRNAGALSPSNITDDLIIGGTATSSAPFQVFGSANGTTPAGTASMSGQLTFATTSQVNLLNNASLAFYSSPGGDSGLSTLPTMLIASNKRVGIGLQSSASSVNTALQVGDPSRQTANPHTIYVGEYSNTKGTPSYIGSWASPNLWAIGPYSGSSTDNMLRIGNLSGSTQTSWAATQNLVLSVGGGIGIGNTSGVLGGTFDVSAQNGTIATASISGATSFAGLVVDNSGVGDLFTASSSGLPRFTITQNGNVGIGTTTPAEKLQLAGGNILLDNNQFYEFKDSLGAARGVLQLTSSNNLKLTNGAATGNVQIGLSNASNTAGALEFFTQSLVERMRLDANGNLGIGTNFGTNQALGTLDVRSNLGTAPTASLSGATSFAGLVVDNSGVGDIFTASSAGLSRFVIQNNGNIGIGTTTPGALLSVSDTNSPVTTGTEFNLSTTNLTTGNAMNITPPNPKIDANAGVLTSGKIINAVSANHTYMTLDNKDLTVGGHKNQVTIANVNDVFVYDTTRDVDGGRWTSDERAQSSSWYSETVDHTADACVIGTDNRCGAASFPKKSIIVVAGTTGANTLYIFDAKDNSLWMSFNQNATGTAVALGVNANNTMSSVFALDGNIYVGTNGSAATGMYEINFKTDKITRYNATDAEDYTSTIKNRDAAQTTNYVSQGRTALALISATVNDIYAQPIGGKTYVAVATGGGTNGGISLVNETAQTVANLGTASKVYTAVFYSADDVVYGLNSTDKELDVWYAASSKSGNTQAFSMMYDETGVSATSGVGVLGPALYSAAPTINTSAPDALFVTNGTSDVDGQSNTIYVGYNEGMTVIQEKQGDETKGSVKYYNSNSISEEMIGDTRVTLPMAGSGTITAQALFNAAADKDVSIKNVGFTTKGTNGITHSSAIRGTGTTYDGTNYLCTGTVANTCANNTNVDVAQTNFSVSFWVKTASAATTRLLVNKQATPGQVSAATAGYYVGINTSHQLTSTVTDGTTYVTATSTKIVDDSAWHFITVTLNRPTTGSGCNVAGNSCTLTQYIDGVLDGTVTNAVMANSMTNAAAMAIMATTTGANLTTGSMDEFTFVANTTNASEVQHMYQVGYRALNNSNHAGSSTIRGVTVAADAANKLNGSSVVKAARTLVDNGQMYIGTGGGVSVIGMDTDTLTDLYSTSITTKDDVNANYDATNGNAVNSLAISKGYGTGVLLGIGQNNAGAGGVWMESGDTTFKDFLASSYDPFGPTLDQTNLNVDRVFRVTTQASTRLDNTAIAGNTQPLIADIFKADSNGVVINSPTEALYSAGTNTINGLGVSALNNITNTTATTTFNGINVTTPSITQTSGTLTANGLKVDMSGSTITTGGTLNGLTIMQPTTAQSAGTTNAIFLGTSTSSVANTVDSATISVGNIASTATQNLSRLNIQNQGTGMMDLEIVNGFVNNQSINSFDDEFNEKAFDSTTRWNTANAIGAGTATIPTGVVNGVLRFATNTTNPSGAWISQYATLTSGYYQRGNNPIFETAITTPTTGAGVRIFAGFSAANVANGGDTLTTAHAYIGKRAADTAWQCITSDGVTESVTSTGVSIVNTRTRLRIEVKNGTTPEVVCTVGNTSVAKTTNIPGASTAMDLYTKVETSDTTGENVDVDYIRTWQDDPIAGGLTLDTPQSNGLTVDSVSIPADSPSAIDSGQLISDNSTSSAVLSASVSAIPTATSLLASDGIATVSGDLRVKGSGLFEGILTVLDTLNTNTFIANRLAEFFDTVIFHKDVTFEGRPVFNKDTAGFAVIKKGSDHVGIVFEKPYDKAPIVNASIATEPLTPIVNDVDQKTFEQEVFANGYQYVITKRSEKGFTIVLNKPTTDDLQFSWSAIAVKDAKTFESQGSALITPTITITPTIQSLFDTSATTSGSL